MSASASDDSLERLAALLREQGGLMATLVSGRYAPTRARPVRAGPPRSPPSGPRAQRARDRYELLVETIYEGYLLHYGAGRVVAPAEADLGLLAGDRLYALGLARLVELGDTAAVAELADTITLSALAQAAGEPALAEAVWEAGAHAVGWGSSDAHATRQAPGVRPRPRGDRGDAHKHRGGPDAALNRAPRYCSSRCPPSTISTSPSTRSTASTRARSRARPSRVGGS